MKTVVVIPHHLPTLNFLEEWRQEFESPDVHVLIVEDKPNRQTEIPFWLMEKQGNGSFSIYTHKDIDKELGKDAWVISRGTSAVRSYGLYKAWQLKPDMIITLDNDCFPNLKMSFDYFVYGHWRTLETPATLDWFS